MVWSGHSKPIRLHIWYQQSHEFAGKVEKCPQVRDLIDYGDTYPWTYMISIVDFALGLKIGLLISFCHYYTRSSASGTANLGHLQYTK